MSAQGPTPNSGTPAIAISEVRFEHGRNTLGICVARPRLSWIVATTVSVWRQIGYEIESLGPDGQPQAQTGWIASDESVFVSWPFAPLVSRERLAVRFVRFSTLVGVVTRRR